MYALSNVIAVLAAVVLLIIAIASAIYIRMVSKNIRSQAVQRNLTTANIFFWINVLVGVFAVLFIGYSVYRLVKNKPLMYGLDSGGAQKILDARQDAAYRQEAKQVHAQIARKQKTVAARKQVEANQRAAYNRTVRTANAIDNRDARELDAMHRREAMDLGMGYPGTARGPPRRGAGRGLTAAQRGAVTRQANRARADATKARTNMARRRRQHDAALNDAASGGYDRYDFFDSRLY